MSALRPRSQISELSAIRCRPELLLLFVCIIIKNVVPNFAPSAFNGLRASLMSLRFAISVPSGRKACNVSNTTTSGRYFSISRSRSNDPYHILLIRSSSKPKHLILDSSAPASSNRPFKTSSVGSSFEKYITL